MSSAPAHCTPLEIAKSYLIRGWNPIPVPFRSKNPGFNGWQHFAVTEDELPRHFNGRQQNIGVLLGEASGDLADVDLDCAEAVALAPHYLPLTGAIFGRQTRPRSHWLYVAPIPSKVTFTDPLTGKRLIELLTNGQQAIFPGSVHQDTGELIRWYEDGDPTRVSESDLLNAIKKLAAATLIAHRWPQEGSRQDAALALAGVLLRAGWSEEAAAHFVEAVCRAASDEESRSRVQAVCHTARKLEAGKHATGRLTLANIIDRRVVDRACEWLEIRTDPRAEALANTWNEPEELPDDLCPVPAFDPCLLPEALRAWIVDISERMQCPVEFPAVAALTAAASLIGNRLRIRPKRADDWTVVPNLWGAIVGKPGVLKSPAQEEALKPLRARERIAREEYRAAMEGFAFQRLCADAQRDQLKKDIQKAVREGRDGSEYRARLAEAQADVPAERRYVVNDPTVEKLGELLNRQLRLSLPLILPNKPQSPPSSPTWTPNSPC